MMPETPQLPIDLGSTTTDTYDVILADPPWQYEHSRSRRRSIERHYPTLSPEQIASIPVGSLASASALLYLWATPPKLNQAVGVLEAWGFTYVTCAVWNKLILGLGYHFRQQHELLLVGKRGRPGTPPPSRRVPSVIYHRRGKHSAKPPQIHEYIEDAFPLARRIELFARVRREGWSAWGNEVECDVTLDVPAVATEQLSFLP
jgi:N6-adenosine-specific RNA methylase IME4